MGIFCFLQKYTSPFNNQRKTIFKPREIIGYLTPDSYYITLSNDMDSYHNHMNMSKIYRKTFHTSKNNRRGMKNIRAHE